MARGKKKETLTPEERLQAALVPESEQPYPVPENWCWTRLGAITEIIGGGTPSSNISEYYNDGTIPWISPADLSGYTDIYISKGAKNITALGLEKSSAKMLPTNTVCLSSRAPIGYVVIAENPLCTNQGFKSFLPASCYLARYLYWYLKGNKELLESYASGTTFLELSASKAGLVEFPLAPLAEQQRIVDRIKSLFAKLDEAKQKAQDALDSFETRKAAILHKAFTGELTARWRKEHGVGMESWDKKTIDDVFFVFSGKGFKEKEYSPNGIKLLRISNVTYDSLIWDDTKYLPNEYEKIVPELLLNPTDIVLALNRPITNGKLKISVMNNTEPVILYQRVACLRMRENYCVDFLRFSLESKDFLCQIQNNLQGSDQPYINLPPLKKLTLQICSLDEQTEIVRILNNILAKEQQAKEAAEGVLEQIDLIKKAILARAFRGELGTNDPSEESAVELVKRVLAVEPPPKTRAKAVSIPREVEEQLKSELERKIIKSYYYSDSQSLPIDTLMEVSSKKFEVLESIRNLEQRGLIKKLPNGNYKLVR